MRQNEDERDQQNDLAQTGQQQADLGLSQRHNALLAGDLEAHGKDTVIHIRHIFLHKILSVLIPAVMKHHMLLRVGTVFQKDF